MNTEPKHSEVIIKACCMLHNYIKEKDGINFENNENIIDEDNDTGTAVRNHPSRRYAMNLREKLANYFCNEGAVSWQESNI